MIDIENKEEIIDEESEFADEAKQEETKADSVEEAPAVEEAKEEAPAVEMQKEEEPEEEVSPSDFDYGEPTLKSIEEGRLNFFKTYRKVNMIKWAITAVIVIFILAAWILPGQTALFPEESWVYKNQVAITVVVLVLALIAMWLSSRMFKKKTDEEMKKYFHNYYTNTDSFVFGEAISNKEGNVDYKLDQQVMIDSNLYADIIKVGSRNCINFDYKGQHCVFSDCAAQIRGQKALQTVFVGKMLVTDNAWDGDDMIIYLKGNKRALPPTTLNYYELLEDSKYMVVYGSQTCKKFLTKKVRDALGQFKTNKTLVDVAISIRGGKTYIAMGYEDNLMILPMDKPFNPNPTVQFKNDIEKVFALLDAIRND